MTEQEKCPTCGGTNFRDRDGGPDTYEDDITWTDRVCQNCGTYEHGWTGEWLTEDDEPASNQDDVPASIPQSAPVLRSEPEPTGRADGASGEPETGAA